MELLLEIALSFIAVLILWFVSGCVCGKARAFIIPAIPLLAALGVGSMMMRKPVIGEAELAKVLGRNSMRAAICDAAAPEGIRVDGNAALPAMLSEDSLLVKVHAGALNPVDVKLLSKLPVLPFLRWFMPNRVASDFAGVVEYVPPGASSKCANYPQGSKIFGMTSEGAFQDYTVVPCDGPIAILPSHMSMEEAAGLGVAAVTTWDALIARHTLKKDQRLLVIGGSGGTGQMGILMGKHLGAHVTTIASGRNSDFVRSLGADEVVDYTSDSFATYQPKNKFDLIYDTVSSPTHGDPNYEPQARPWLVPSSTYVAINGFGVDWPRAMLSLATGVNLQRPFYDLFVCMPTAEKFAGIAKMCQSGDVKVVIDSNFTLDSAGVQGSFQRQNSRRAKGKLIVKM